MKICSLLLPRQPCLSASRSPKIPRPANKTLKIRFMCSWKDAINIFCKGCAMMRNILLSSSSSVSVPNQKARQWDAWLMKTLGRESIRIYIPHQKHPQPWNTKSASALRSWCVRAHYRTFGTRWITRDDEFHLIFACVRSYRAGGMQALMEGRQRSGGSA